jgi:hypothetical protein
VDFIWRLGHFFLAISASANQLSRIVADSDSVQHHSGSNVAVPFLFLMQLQVEFANLVRVVVAQPPGHQSNHFDAGANGGCRPESGSDQFGGLGEVSELPRMLDRPNADTDRRGANFLGDGRMSPDSSIDHHGICL